MLQSLQFGALQASRTQASSGRLLPSALGHGRGAVAAVDTATYQEPFAQGALLIRERVQIQGYHFWGKKPLGQRLLEIEGVQQEVLLPLPCSCTLPRPLLLATAVSWTLGQVELSPPLVWPVLSVDII